MTDLKKIKLGDDSINYVVLQQREVSLWGGEGEDVILEWYETFPTIEGAIRASNPGRNNPPSVILKVIGKALTNNPEAIQSTFDHQPN